MKRISFWAYHHKWTARFLIVFSLFIINCIGLFLGDALVVAKFIVPSLWVYGLAFLFIVAFVNYPAKKEKSRYQNFYRRQKGSDLLLLSTTFLLIINYGNHYQLQRNQSPFHFTYASASEIRENSLSATEIPIVPSTKKKPSLIKQWKKKLKENIRTIRKEYKEASPGERAALIVLTLIVALALLFLVLNLSCSLSCSGSDGAALVVALLGTALIVFFAVRVIKRINRGKPRKVTNEFQSTSVNRAF